jgi:hypothetical protein
MLMFRHWLKINWPFLIILLVTLIFFWKFFLKGLVPIPADIITGTYFPWYDLHFAGFPAGIPVKNNILSDVVSITYPWRKLAVDLMKSGTLPLWNPYILSGSVLLANITSVPFYPLNIIYWIIPDFSKAWSFQIILQPLLAGIFMYIFLKNNKLSGLSSLFGSLVWGFSGFFMVWLEYNTIVHASLYFPLILYAIQKSFENKKYYLLLSLAISLSFYAGYPQITFYELLFAGLFVLIVYPSRRIKNYFALIFYVLLGVGLSLPFLLPAYEATNQSVRQVDDIANQTNVKFILPEQVIAFVAPDYFGNPTYKNYWLEDRSYENAIVFAGVPAFLLFLASFFINKKDKSRVIYYSWLAFLVAAVLAFKNPISEYLGNSNLFLFSSSVMGRLAVILMFAMAVSSSFVLEAIVKRRFVLAKLLIPIGLTICLMLIFAYNGFNSHNSVALRNLILPSIMLVGFLILTAALIKLKNYTNLLLIGFVLLELFDLYRFHNKYNPFTDPTFLYPKTPLIDFLSSQSPGRFESELGPTMPPNMWMPYGLYSASGQDAVGSLRYNKFLEYINNGYFKTSNRYMQIANYDSPLFDFLGIANIAAVKRKNGNPDFEGVVNKKLDNPKFQKVFEDGRSLVLKNTKAYPRIFSVENYVLAKTDGEFEVLLKSEDLSKTVILEEVPKVSFSKADTKIENIKFEANSTSAEIKSSAETMIVLTQSYFSGWNAYIDGIKTKLYRADYDFMAIPVPVGGHKIVVRYEPVSFRLGLIGGGISVICLFVCYLFLKKSGNSTL